PTRESHRAKARCYRELAIHNPSAIWMKHLTGHVGGIVRSEKNKTSGDFFRFTGPAQRCVGTKCRDFVGWECRRNQRRPDWSRRDRVYPDFLVRERLRQGPSKGDDRAFG